MFYEEEQLNTKLCCPNCSKRFDEPLLLPCANIICQRCVTSIKGSLGPHLNRFPCPLCNDYHDFPTSSFPICKPVKDILNQQPKEVYRGILAEKLKSNLTDLRLKVNELNGDINAGMDKVRNHCQQLRKEVNSATDAAFKYIEALNDSLIKQIDSYENQILKPFETIKDANTDSDMSALILELKKFHSQWEKYLKQLTVDDDLIENANDKADSFKNKLDMEKSRIHDFFFTQKHLEYEKNKHGLDSKLLGVLKVVNTYKDSDSKIDDYEVLLPRNKYLSRNSNGSTRENYREHKVLTGHTSGVSAVALLKNGDLVSSSYDKTLRLWSLKTGEVKKILKGHTSCVSAVVVMPNGELVSGSWDTSIKLWNLDNGKYDVKYSIHAHKSKVITLIALPNGDLASGSWDRKIKIWEMRTYTCKITLVGHAFSVIALTLLRNDELASGSEDSTIKVWDINTGELKKTLVGHSSVVKALCSLPGGGIASGSWDSTIKIWTPKYAELKNTLTGHSSGVLSLMVLPNGDLASASADKTIKLWSIDRAELHYTINAHTDSIWVVILLPNGELLSCSADSTIKIWTKEDFKSSSQLSILSTRSVY